MSIPKELPPLLLEVDPTIQKRLAALPVQDRWIVQSLAKTLAAGIPEMGRAIALSLIISYGRHRLRQKRAGAYAAKGGG